MDVAICFLLTGRAEPQEGGGSARARSAGCEAEPPPVRQCHDEAARLAVEWPGGQQGTVLGRAFCKNFSYLAMLSTK